MRYLRLLLSFFLLFALAACGGGGGSAGSAVNSGDLRTTASGFATLDVGVTNTYEILGGVPPYRFGGTDKADIATGSVSGTTLTVATKAAGTAIVTVLDNKGVSVTVTVTVGSSVALTTTAPTSFFVLPGQTLTFAVAGGGKPYTATSADSSVVKATVSDGVLSIQGVQAGGPVAVTINDKFGLPTTQISLNVSVGSASQLSVNAPKSLTIQKGQQLSFVIKGGVPPYSAFSSDGSVLSASVTGSDLLLKGLLNGSASVLVKDNAQGEYSLPAVQVGSSVVVPISFSAGASVTLVVGNSQNYRIFGASQTYIATTNNPGVADAFATGSAVTVRPIAVGDAEINVVGESDGQAQKLKVTVIANAANAVVSANPQLRNAGLKDAAGASTNSIGTSGYTTLSVQLTDPLGQPIPNQLITVTDPAVVKLVSFPEGLSGLTNANGVASIRLQRESLVATGAGALTVTYSYKAGSILSYPSPGISPPTLDTVVSTYVGYQLATANVTLTNLDIGAATMAAYGTRSISVTALVNGQVPSLPIPVTFGYTCGVISPQTVSTNNAGVASSTYTAVDAAGVAGAVVISTQGCSGKTVQISASATGAAEISKSLGIDVAPATSIAFTGATPARIFLANSGGESQSILKFKLINDRGEALLGQDVILTLKTVNGNSPPKAYLGSIGNVAAITSTTDASGEVSVPVFSGTVPTSVQVNAALKSNSKIQTDSATLTIASGRPAQARVSLSIEKLAIEGANLDGDTTKVTLSLADRQGNPVPDGTAVNFVTSGGVMIPPTCTTGVTPGDSQCVVTIRTQNPRLSACGSGVSVPCVAKAGYVEILAYSAGEEDFVDANFNNVYDAGEVFTDLSPAFRDDNIDGIYQTGEFSVPRTGASLTSGTKGVGDGAWGAADVRKQATIVFSTSGAVISSLSATSTGISYLVADGNGNSMPTGSTITVKAVDNSPGNLLGCNVVTGTPIDIPNSLGPFVGFAGFETCVAGDSVVVEVKTPKTQTVTSKSFLIN